MIEPSPSALLKEKFELERKELILKRVRICALIITFLNPLFILLDQVTSPAMLSAFITIRIISTIICIAILALSYLGPCKNIATGLGVIILTNIGCAISLMIQFLGGYESSYYAGLNLVFLGMGLLLPWRLGDAFLTGILVYASYLTPIFLFEKITHWPIFINNNAFLSATFLISLIATYVGHQYRWKEFQDKFNLGQSNQALAQAKEELENAYHKLEELDQMKTQFFANISHELRTPLTLILAPVGTLIEEENKKSPEDRRKGFEVIQDNALRLLKLVNHLLDLMKIDSEKFDLNVRKVHVESLIREIQDSITPLAKQKGLELDFKTEDALNASFDRDQIEKVLLNLIYNAIKFTDKGGKIIVKTQKILEELEITVEDNGIGIAPEMLDKIFDRFTQAHTGTARRYEGTGVGLALCKELVKLHGGSISVQSELGKGSIFKVRLPMKSKNVSETIPEKEEESTPKETEGTEWLTQIHREAMVSGTDLLLKKDRFGAQSQKKDLQNGKPLILISEDNPDLLSFLGSQLQCDYQVILTGNGEEALQALEQELPQLIIADIMMPKMDGYELCRRVKQNPKTQEIPVVFLTAKAELDMRIEGYKQGVDDYLIKPFNIQELKSKIKAILMLSRLNKALQEKNQQLHIAFSDLQTARDEQLGYVHQMASSLAHEIGNPLQAIRLHLEMMEELSETSQFPKETAQAIYPHLERMKALVKQLTHIGKTNKLEISAINPLTAIEETLNLLGPKLKSALIHLVKDFKAPATFIDGDKNQLVQVFFNLIKNALEAMPQGGTLEIKTEKTEKNEQSFYRILFKDSGIGITEETMTHVFNPFYTTKKEGGSGLGLSISQKIVNAHGGTLTARSKDGEGSTFIVELPLESKRPI